MIKKIKEATIDKWILFFLVILFFTIFPTQFVPFYQKYIDKREYVSVEVPVVILQKEYHAGDCVIVSIKRIALIDTSAISIKELVLKGDQNQFVYSFKTDINFEKGEKIGLVEWKLPDKLVSGTYYWSGMIEYEYKGIKRYFAFYSEDFSVTQLSIESNGI